MNDKVSPMIMKSLAAADAVAARMARNPPAKDFLVKEEALFDMAGVAWPAKDAVMTMAEAEKHQLWACRFVEHLKERLMIDIGRDLRNVPGAGYRLLAPAEVVPEAEKDVVKGVTKAIGKFRFKEGHVDDNALTMGEIDAKRGSLARVESIGTALKIAQRQEKRTKDLRARTNAAPAATDSSKDKTATP